MSNAQLAIIALGLCLLMEDHKNKSLSGAVMTLAMMAMGLNSIEIFENVRNPEYLLALFEQVAEINKERALK